MRNQRNNKGFSSVEVIIACVVLSLGLLPVFGMMSAGTRQSHFSEYSLFAAPRAKRILETYLTFNYRYFENMDETQELDIEDVVNGSEPPMPKEYLAKLDQDGYKETAEWKDLGNGLGRISVTIEWTFPADGEKRAGKPHRFVLKRLISRPDLSMSTDLEWAQSNIS